MTFYAFYAKVGLSRLFSERELTSTFAIYAVACPSVVCLSCHCIDIAIFVKVISKLNYCAIEASLLYAVYTIQPVVKPVVNRIDNRLYRVNGALAVYMFCLSVSIYW